MEFDLIREWGGLLVSGGTLLWAVYLFVRGARKEELDALRQGIDKQKAEIDQLKAELTEHKQDGSTSRAALSERLGHVETKLQQMPDKESVHQLAIAVTEIRGDIRTQGETMKAVAATASRVEEFLLQRNKA